MFLTVITRTILLGLILIMNRAAPLAVETGEDGSMSFEETFTGDIMRIDTFHSGSGREENFSVRRIMIEGEWAGPQIRLDDDLGLGKYRYLIRDRKTESILFSRGYCSIFGEWETTGEATGETWKTFQETFIFPEPRRPATLTVEKRLLNGEFAAIWKINIPPEPRHLERRSPGKGLSTWDLFISGKPSTKVDLLILGDGYTESETNKFHSDARRMTDTLFKTEPFAGRKNDFNVRAIDLVSEESGISDPRRSRWKKTALGLTFNALDLDRYVLTFEEDKIRDVAAAAPYDFILIIFNSSKYGGGGIYNLWMTCASDAASSPYVFVHEFGHLFAGLADEYYSSNVTYENFSSEPAEPWEPNVTALADPGDLKWKALTDPATPVPTPWDQEKYDRISAGTGDQQQKLSREERLNLLKELITGEPYYGKVGAFEGACYRAKGLYRPEIDCTMFSAQSEHGFCRVCRAAIERVINLYTGEED